MEIQNTLILHTANSAETESIAENIGKQLKGGEIIELAGDVGAGKTTFVRGLARGIGSEDRVTSPTFTVSKVYESPKLQLHHYDFYRLSDLEIIQNELTEVLSLPGHSVVLEWAEEVRQVLPTDHIKIEFKAVSETERALSLVIPENYQYIRIENASTDN